MKQSIILLPKFNNQSEIEQLRQLYDPLYLKIPPHITLYFLLIANYPLVN